MDLCYIESGITAWIPFEDSRFQDSPLNYSTREGLNCCAKRWPRVTCQGIQAHILAFRGATHQRWLLKNFLRSTHRAKHVVPGRPAGAASTSPGKKLRARVMRSTATYYGDPDPSTKKESAHFSQALHGWHEFHVRAEFTCYREARLVQPQRGRWWVRDGGAGN